MPLIRSLISGVAAKHNLWFIYIGRALSRTTPTRTGTTTGPCATFHQTHFLRSRCTIKTGSRTTALEASQRPSSPRLARSQFWVLWERLLEHFGYRCAYASSFEGTALTVREWILTDLFCHLGRPGAGETVTHFRWPHTLLPLRVEDHRPIYPHQ